MVTQVTHKQVQEGPITRSRAKKLQQEVNALLCEIYFNINENYILPKMCTLLVFRFTKEDDKNTKGEDNREGPHSNLRMDSDRIRMKSDPNVTFYHILIRIRMRMRISDTNTKRIVRIRIFET